MSENKARLRDEPLWGGELLCGSAGGPLVECIPNFSEGRRRDVVEAIAAAVQGVDGVIFLDSSMDPDHNRSVLTFAGPPSAVKLAAYRAIEEAARLINMEEHRGEHPRIGAADVVPFVPLCGVTMGECVALARSLGGEVSSSLGIPVYLYEEAALVPERRDLAWVRRGGYERLKREICNPERRPDFGEPRLHPTAGAVAIGARRSLVAFNINLGTDDLEIAKKIASAVRARSGGLAFVKALGVKLASKGNVQVTMNLTDYTKTPIHRAFELVRMEAEHYGVRVIGSEIIGLVPLQALLDVAGYYLRLDGLGLDNVLEARLLRERGLTDSLQRGVEQNGHAE